MANLPALGVKRDTLDEIVKCKSILVGLHQLVFFYSTSNSTFIRI